VFAFILLFYYNSAKGNLGSIPCQLSIQINLNFSAHQPHINSTITWHNYMELEERVGCG